MLPWGSSAILLVLLAELAPRASREGTSKSKISPLVQVGKLKPRQEKLLAQNSHRGAERALALL